MLKHLLRGRGSGIKGDSWVALLGYSNHDYSDFGKSVAIGPDGSVYVCGYTDTGKSPGYIEHKGGFIAKFDSSGAFKVQR